LKGEHTGLGKCEKGGEEQDFSRETGKKKKGKVAKIYEERSRTWQGRRSAIVLGHIQRQKKKKQKRFVDAEALPRAGGGGGEKKDYWKVKGEKTVKERKERSRGEKEVSCFLRRSGGIIRNKRKKKESRGGGKKPE